MPENTKKNDTLHNKAIIVDELPNGQNIIYMKKEIWEKILNNEDSLKLDEIADKSIRTENLRNKLLKISNKLKELKDGKKNAR